MDFEYFWETLAIGTAGAKAFYRADLITPCRKEEADRVELGVSGT